MTTEVDPIFTAIAAYTAAVEHHGAMLDAEESLEVTEEVTDLAVDQESQALRAMLTTTPTTIAGAAALLDYLATTEPHDENSTGAQAVIGMAFAHNQDMTTNALAALAASLRRARISKTWRMLEGEINDIHCAYDLGYPVIERFINTAESKEEDGNVALFALYQLGQLIDSLKSEFYRLYPGDTDDETEDEDKA